MCWGFFPCWIYRKHFSVQVANKSSLHTYAHGWIFRDAKNKHPQQFYSKCSTSAGVREVQGWTQPSVSFAENKWLQFTVVHGKSVLFYLSLQPLNFRVWKNFRQKLAIKSCRAHAQSVVCNIGWCKILVWVFHQKPDWGLTSYAQKELKNCPGLGVSEQKPPFLPAHTHIDSQNNGICNPGCDFKKHQRDYQRTRYAWEQQLKLHPKEQICGRTKRTTNTNPFSQKKRTSLLPPFSFWPWNTQHHLSHLDSSKLPHVSSSWLPLTRQPAPTSPAAQSCLRAVARAEARPGATRNRHKPGIKEKTKSFAFLCQVEPKRHFHTFFMFACISESCPPRCPAISQFTVYSLHSLAV